MAANVVLTSKMVIDHYSSIAREGPASNAEHMRKVAESFGYAPEDLADIPEGANLGVSCGNPLAVASLKAGETVIDLGSGAGFDVFQAARKVGPEGLSIGVDMSEDMLALANKNAAKASITNVKFVLAPITKIPLEDASADCIISNCVINLLAPSEKPVCFAEIYRLLKPGGRLAISDILAKKVFPEQLQKDMGLYVGCISGASLVAEYEGRLRDVGFEDIMMVDKKMDLNIYKERNKETAPSCCGTAEGTPAAAPAASSCCSPATAAAPKTKQCSCCGSAKVAAPEEETKEEWNARVMKMDFNEWVSSYSVYAVKPTKA